MSYRRITRTEEKNSSPSPLFKRGSSGEQKRSFIFSVFRLSWRGISLFWYWTERVILLFLILGFAWWMSQKPSNLRDWELQDSLSQMSSFSGESITISHIRNHTWSSNTDFIPGYLSGTYNLSDIEKMYYIITPFGDTDGPAHTMFSFSFSGGQHIVISPEIRKERGETFDAWGGILNQYEIQYVIATEDDIIKLRTNYRKNEVYMYPIRVEKEKIQALFRSMIIRADKLNREPEFYNTLWNNCATNILDHTNAFRINKLRAGKYILFPSHSDELVYHAGLIDTQLSLPEARAYYRIDQISRSSGTGVVFSEMIRKPIR